MLQQHIATLTIQTPGRGLHEITGHVKAQLAASRVANGLLTLFVRHTSASLLIQEKADPDVRGWWRMATRCSGTGMRAMTTCPRMCWRR